MSLPLLVPRAPVQSMDVNRVLDLIDGIEGWLDRDEARLLADVAIGSLDADGIAVEVGSYCGRSTIVLGSVAATIPGARVYAIDPHVGNLGLVGGVPLRTLPTLERFTRNIASAGLSRYVEAVVAEACTVDWGKTIDLLFVDSMHDYENVSRDFQHFEAWLRPGGAAVFHDYSDDYPGVVTFVDDLLAHRHYCLESRVENLIVLRKEDTLYGQSFFEPGLAGAIRSAQAVVPIILNLVPVRSVVDFGCGWGAWLATFRDLGVGDILGIDGDYIDRSKLLIDPGQFLASDLEQPVILDRRFDLAICLEVAEHLQERAAAILVSSLVSAAPVILFSAATPGQGGKGHVNEQLPGYWASLFADLGFVQRDSIRPLIDHDDVDPWYRSNIFLYMKPDQVRD